MLDTFEVESIRKVLGKQGVSGGNLWYILYRTKPGFWDDITIEADTPDEARCSLVSLLREMGVL